MINNKQNWVFAILACLTLGLAPHHEPHIWKQIMNLYLGRPMLMMDWVDILMHGAPWGYLVYLVVKSIRSSKLA
jgi:hypothetical protein